MRDAARMPRDDGTRRLHATGAMAALVAGALAALFLPTTLPYWASAALLLLAASAAIARTRAALRVVIIATFGFAWAALHAQHAMAIRLPLALEGHDVRLRGRVIDLPQHDARRVHWRMRIDDDAPNALRGQIVRLAWYHDAKAAPPDVRVGSRWELDARLRAPRGLRNPGWFDAERHALVQRIAATGYVRNAGAARELAPPAGLQAWRANMSARIDNAIDAPSARFIQALALGDTRGLDDTDWSTLRAIGLTHLIAISGFHVGLVAGFFALVASLAWRVFPTIARRIPRPIAMAIAAVIGAVAYTAIAGFALPTVRTTLMIAVIAALRCARRAQSSFAALSIAIIAMVLVDPLSLLGAGFWLSVCGVAWLLWCLPRTDTGVVRSFAAAQSVATVGLLPLTVALFGQASLVGPLANLFAIPWWSLVVVPLSLLGTGLEAVHSDWGAMWWRAAALTFDATWPAFVALGDSAFAFAWLPEARWFALPMALVGAFWLLLPREVPGKPLALLLWLPMLSPSRGLPPHGAFRIDMIDVGQGLSVLVRTTSHAVLFDMGPASHDGYDAGERAVIPTMRALGVHALDVAIISHADNDHAGGWPAVQRALPVHDIHAPPGSPTQATTHCVAGHGWQRDGVRFTYLHPSRHFPYLGNDASCVLRIEGPHGAALLTGDIGDVVERTLVRRDAPSLAADVVVVPHHGSEGASDPAFIRATGARLAVVASGAGNRFGHPKPTVVTRWCRAGARVIGTAGGGALHVDVGPKGLKAAARRETHARLWDAMPRSGRGAGLCYRPNDGPGPEE